jgi:hypothetical protein
MNRHSLISWLVIVVFGAVGTAVFAQSVRTSTADKYVISARAGGVNFIQGSVAFSRLNGTGGTLIRGDILEIGDKASASRSSRAEVLLNPGSYMRIGPDSQFSFVSTSLDDLQVKLSKGTAVFEVFATEDFKVTVLTPKGPVSLIDSGVYRIDVRRDGVASVAVTEGKAQLGNSKATIVKSGRVGTLGDSLAIAKFDRGNRDEMDEWSRSRSKDLAKATASLKQKDIRTSLINSFNSGRFGMYDSFGLWIYNPYFGAFSFLPFGNRWNSPYGFGFGYGMDWGAIPWWNRNRTTVYLPRDTNSAPVKEHRSGAITAPPYTSVEKQTQRQTRMDNPDTAWPSQRSVTSRGADTIVSTSPAAPVERTEAAGRMRGVKPID